MRIPRVYGARYCPTNMTHLNKTCFVAAVALVLAIPLAGFAKGTLGFEARITSSGFFHPTLEAVSVLAVVPGSAAATAGMRPGDRIVEVDGRPIKGASAEKMAARLDNARPGQHLEFTVERGSELLSLDLVVGH